MYETDFPEYGQQCELVTPWRGYHRGTIVGRTAKGFIVQFSSGAEIEFPGRQGKRSCLPCYLRSWSGTLVHP